jgi:toxin CptA
MDIMIRGLAFGVAALCAVMMGFAIQRGATCTVAAVDEVLGGRGVGRLVALVEASAWVAGGLLIAHRIGWLAQVPSGYVVNLWTVAGALLLGLGAFVNRACVFGAIARFGSGEWAYIATPFGFYLGCVAVARLIAPPSPQSLDAGSIVLGASSVVAWLVAALFAWRVAMPLVQHRRVLRDLLTRHLWSPHAATTVIGVTFLLMMLLVGAWSYTDALAELARGMAHSVTARALLLVCLLAGTLLGGWTAGRFRHTRISAASLLRCVAGGMLMGCGSLLIPGGNDGLILVGMPLFWPYAWVAFATMCIAIAGASAVQRRFTGGTAHGSTI